MVEIYNVTWESPSKDSFDSMPLSGRMGAGANVWCENGALWLYPAHNSAYNENGKLLKLGCIRIEPEGITLKDIGPFTQTLDIEKSEIRITWQSGEDLVTFRLYYISETLVIEADCGKPFALKVSVGIWRDVEVESDNFNKVYRFHNTGAAFPKKVLRIFNRKNSSNSSLDMLKYGAGITLTHKNGEQAAPVLSGREFGLHVTGDFRNYKVASVHWQIWKGIACSCHTGTEKSHTLAIATAGKSVSQLKDTASSVLKNLSSMKFEEEALWKEFWDRSYILVNESRGDKDEGFQVGKNYQLFHYMTACNRGGELPLKFNGGIFTTDVRLHRLNHTIENDGFKNFTVEECSPDYRRWGDMFMSQNQRWLGWCALMSGDRDIISISSKFYRDNADAARKRAKALGATGACYAEPLGVDGACCVSPTKEDTCGAAHLNYHFSMGIEHAYMTMLSHSYLAVDIEEHIPWIIDVIRFFDTFYRKENNKNTGSELTAGKLVLYPCSGLELCAGAQNPVETVAGLTALTGTLLKYDKLKDKDRIYLETVQNILPAIPYTVKDGRRIIALADNYENLYNAWELPEFYTAFPYRIHGVWSEEDKTLLKDTWDSIGPRGDDCKTEYAKMDFSWQCQTVNMACMGAKEDAKNRIIYKLADKENTARFTAFFGPGNDWIPDHNWGGSGMMGLQMMVLQCRGKELYIGAGFPDDWECKFKLYAEGGVVTGELKLAK